MATAHAYETGWSIERSTGPAGPFHARPLPDPARAAVWIHEVASRAVVLGSAQDDTIVDRQVASEAGVEICRRRSGGGLVGLDPGNDLWIDVVVPSSSRLWCDDVGRAFEWLGETWAAALGDVLAPEVTPSAIRVHRGPLVDGDKGRIVCFAGLGPGEVTVSGRKVVGLSQRRTRGAARFQAVMTWGWEPTWLAALIDPAALAAIGMQLHDLAVGLPSSVVESAGAPTASAVTEAFLTRLPPA